MYETASTTAFCSGGPCNVSRGEGCGWCPRRSRPGPGAAAACGKSPPPKIATGRRSGGGAVLPDKRRRIFSGGAGGADSWSVRTTLRVTCDILPDMTEGFVDCFTQSHEFSNKSWDPNSFRDIKVRSQCQVIHPANVDEDHRRWAGGPP